MRVLFMGTPEFAVPSLGAVAAHHDLVAVVTRPDRPRGRGRRVAPSAVKEWAEAHGIPVEQPSTLRTPEARERLAAHRPEIIVVVAYGLILPPEVLDLPPRGCINVHASLLPRHRGAAPVAWTILSGDQETGVTTMLMDPGMDTGPILMQWRDAVGSRETAAELAARLSEAGAKLVVETLARWRAGDLEPVPQNDEEATLAPRLEKKDGEIDWSETATAIDRRVRALQPWPGTHTYLFGERLRLWSVEPIASGARDDLDPVATTSIPGTVVGAGDDGIRVACGDAELLRIDELQIAGRRRQPAAEFLRGHPLPVGTELGQEQV